MNREEVNHKIKCGQERGIEWVERLIERGKIS